MLARREMRDETADRRDEVDLGGPLYANHILRGRGTRHLPHGLSRGLGGARREPKILYLIAVSRAPALPAGMLLVKSHQNGVKTIYILPYAAAATKAFLVGAVRVIRGWSLIHGLHSPTCYDRAASEWYSRPRAVDLPRSISPRPGFPFCS